MKKTKSRAFKRVMDGLSSLLVVAVLFVIAVSAGIFGVYLFKIIMAIQEYRILLLILTVVAGILLAGYMLGDDR